MICVFFLKAQLQTFCLIVLQAANPLNERCVSVLSLSVRPKIISYLSSLTFLFRKKNINKRKKGIS